MSEKIISPKGKLSYPHLFERHTKGDYPSDMYETLLLIPKSTDISALKEACESLLQETFKGKFKDISELEHPPIKDGDDYTDDRKGHWVIKAKSDNRPQVVGPNPKIVIDDKEEVYGGRWARLSLNLYSYNKAGKKGISFGLRNVQLLEKGEKLGGASASDPSKEFAEETVVDEDAAF